MYNLFYNLNDRPFSSKPDLKYFFATRPHKQAILHMRVGFEQADGILILSGEKGLGKTTLITHMLEQLDKNDNIVAFIQQPSQKDDDFLLAILAALQIPAPEHQSKALFNSLHTFLLEQAELNKKIRLVIDNAESLSHNRLEFIRLLSTLRLNEHSLLQIVLVGTNELEVALSSNENQTFRQQISMSYCMHPLQVADTREYVEHRLKVAGWNEDPVIDDDVFGAIHQLTGGVPHAINRYFDRLLILSMLRETHHINNKDVSNLTSATMEKLEKFEAERLEHEKRNESPEAIVEQLSPPNPKPNNATPFQQTTKEINMENNTFDTPVKKTKPFFNKQTIITIAAVYLVSTIAFFAFDKLSKSNPDATTITTHSEVKDHAAANDHSAASGHSVAEPSHGSGSGQAKYVLNEMSSESIAQAQLDHNAPETQLLDIQLLLNRSHKLGSEVNNNNPGETMSNASGTSSHSTTRARSESQSVPASQHSPEIAFTFNMD